MAYKNEFLERAIKLAAENIERGGGPFGAVIVKDGKIIAEGTNRVTENNDPTAHAEVQAIREACQKLETFNLAGCEIYASCEPCPMCFSSIYWAHLDKVYFAANKNDAAKIGFDDAFIYEEIALQHDERKIPFQEIKNELRLFPFEKWEESNRKTEY